MENNFQSQMQSSITQAPKRNLPRDVFLHLFAMVALYWSAIAFINLCFELINYILPDLAMVRYGYYLYRPRSIKFAMASLVILFPLFILASWYLNKVYRRESAVRDSKIRKWLIYLTLFITSLVMVGDLVAVIYRFLDGIPTLNFILKCVVVLTAAAAVFGYYLDDVRRSIPSKLGKYFATASGAVVLAVFVGSFFVVGSPLQAGLARQDGIRVQDLQSIQSQIVNYWQMKGELPKKLSDLQDSISGYVVPLDPVTGQDYEYMIKDATTLRFELCAAFSTKSSNNDQSGPKHAQPYPVYGEFSQNWDHAVGRVCFERTIDRQLYPPPLNKVK